MHQVGELPAVTTAPPSVAAKRPANDLTSSELNRDTDSVSSIDSASQPITEVNARPSRLTADISTASHSRSASKKVRWHFAS